ncbi:MAG: enoyl-CoA hydratase/isomerase family protein [Burkholderiales bacterium]
MSELLIDEPAHGVRRLTLNRPHKLNALSRGLAEQLIAAIDAADRDDQVRVVILRAAGNTFCAGADLSEHFTGEDEAPDIGRTGLWARLEGARVPIICAVQGWAITGGFLLVYCCDLVIAAEDAKFRDTHATLGLIPTGGESQRMPRRLGLHLARELMLTSRPMLAEEAKAAGLVSRVVPRDQLDDAALEMANAIAANVARSVRTIKKMINFGIGLDMPAGLHFEELTNNFGAANNEPDPERDRRTSKFRH